MADHSESLQRIVDRALEDPKFLGRLSRDPEGVAKAEKLDLTSEDVEALRNASGSEKKMVEALNSRLSRKGIVRRVP